jgi:protein-S-isoprenylcysteine O-methyltransferase Ste14
MERPRHLPLPPFLFLGCLLSGFALSVPIPLRFGLPPWIRVAAALVLAVPAGALAGSALRHFFRANTTLDPKGTASSLLVTGAFRHTRNPLYVSLVAGLVWIGLLADRPWVALMAPVLVLILSKAVIPREEASLAAAFGEAYTDYRKRVRRWL